MVYALLDTANRGKWFPLNCFDAPSILVAQSPFSPSFCPRALRTAANWWESTKYRPQLFAHSACIGIPDNKLNIIQCKANLTTRGRLRCHAHAPGGPLASGMNAWVYAWTAEHEQLQLPPSRNGAEWCYRLTRSRMGARPRRGHGTAP